VEVNKLATTEELVSIMETKLNRLVQVRVHIKDGHGEVIQNEAFDISDENYDLLMSESPSFAPGKPLNEYREQDIWHVIDLIRMTP
jgi:hypothetical protein